MVIDYPAAINYYSTSELMNQDRHPGTPKSTAISANTPIKLGDHYELILNWYKVNGKSLAGEESLSGLHIKNLMAILGNPIWNQIYHCWQIEPKHMAEMQAYTKHRLDPEKFVYFVEAYNTQREL
jgi:hypothetical protein